MLNLNLAATSREHSLTFLQKMLNAMDMSFHKYGPVKDNYTGRYTPEFLDAMAANLSQILREWQNKESTTAGGNAILFILKRLYAYVDGFRSKTGKIASGNTEFLIDAANGCMIEYMSPQIHGAVETQTTDEQSPGFVGLYINELKSIRNDDE